jgi:hypothetical protein
MGEFGDNIGMKNKKTQLFVFLKDLSIFAALNHSKEV